MTAPRSVRAAPGMPPRIGAVVRLGTGQLALRDLGDSDGDGVQDEWHLLAWDGTRWGPIVLPQAFAQIAAVEQSGDGRWIQLEELGDADGDGVAGEKGWWFRGDDGAFTPLAQALPGAPAALVDDDRAPPLRTIGTRHVVGLTVPVQDARAEAQRSERRFWVWTQGRFAPLGEALGLGALELDAAVSFAGEAGVAVRALTGDGKAVKPGDWLAFMCHGERGYRPLSEVVAGAPDRTFDVASFGGGKGFGVQRVPGPDRGGEWQFFLADAGRWVPLAERVKGLPERPAAVASATLEQGLAIRDDGGERTWVLPAGDGRFAPIRELLPELPARIASVDADQEGGGLVSVQPEGGGAKRWYAKDARGRWIALDPLLAAPEQGPEVADRIPARVEPAKEPPALAVALAPPRRPELRARHLARTPDGEWSPLESRLPGLPPGRVAVRALADGVGLEVTAGGAGARPRFFVAGSDGAWVDLATAVPGAPARVQRAHGLLGGRALAVQEDGDADGDGTPGAWSWFVRAPGGGWRPLLPELPGAPRKVLALVPIGSAAGVSLQEEGDSDGDGKPGTWHHFLCTAAGAFVPLRAAIPSAPAKLWQVRALDGDRVLALQEEGDADRDGKAFGWRWHERGADGAWRELLPALPDAPRDVDAARAFWGGSGLALRGVGAAGGPPRWHLYRRAGAGWRAVRVPEGAWRDFSGVEAWGVLALRELGDPDGDGAPGAWRLHAVAADGAASPLALAGGAAVLDVRFFEAAGRLALETRAAGQPSRWRWLQRTAAGAFAPLGTTATPDWPGLSFEGRSDGSVRVEGATHVLDGRAAEAVPEPALWFHRRADVAGSGRVLRAPALVPAGVELYAPGAKGAVLVYEANGRRVAAAFTEGTIELGAREVQRSEGRVERVPVILNHFDDGTARLHLLEDPTRWIWIYEDRELGRVSFDDRGHFYSTVGKLAEVMAFRNGDEVYTFGQLSAHLFRPDKLEERLGLPAGSLFELTDSDRAAIARARELSRDGQVDVAALAPPRLELGEVPAEVRDGRVEIPFRALGRPGRELAISMRVLGLGQARGAAAQERRVAPPAAGAGAGEVRSRAIVPLVPGENVIEVVVTDGDRLTDTRQVRVRHVPREKVQSDLWVAVVAAGDYRRGLPPLPLTQEDARTVRAAFEAQEGRAYRKVHVLALCEDAAACAGRPDSRTVGERLPAFYAGMRDGDAAVLYVSGHGLKRHGRYYFVPPDAEADDTSHMIGWDALRSFLTSAQRLGRKLVILDTCHSGAVAGDAREKNRIVQQAAELEGLYILSASAADASAFELRELNNGIFTYALRLALDGKADRSPEDGAVGFEELARYLGDTVREVSSAHHIRQEPHVPVLDAWMDYVVARVDRARFKVKLEVVRTVDGRLRVNEREALAEWEAALRRGVEGVRLVDEAQMAYRLTLVEKRKRVVVTLERSGTKKPLLEREVPRADAIALVAAALARER